LNIISTTINFTLIGFLSLTVFSCALIRPTPEKLDKNIQAWLSQNEFEEIDNALSRIKKNDAKFKSVLELEPLISVKRNLYINEVSDTAKKLKQEDNWQQALNTFDNALKKIPNEPRLSQERDNLIIERDEQVSTLKKDMMMQRANALISYKKVYDKLLELIPNDTGAQKDILRYNANRIEVAEQLNLCGEQARKNKQYLLATDCYSLSDKLEPTKDKQQWVSSINKQLIKNSNKKSHDELLAAYHTAYKKREYNKARQHLNTVLAVNPKHGKSLKLLNSLNKEVSDMTQEKITAGKDFYNNKKIDDALKLWQQALLLEPDNAEIIQLIKRAEKVSKKIQSLEENQ